MKRDELERINDRLLILLYNAICLLEEQTDIEDIEEKLGINEQEYFDVMLAGDLS